LVYQAALLKNDEAGLYYYGARYYDVGIRRFACGERSRTISADTVVQSYANPQTLNRYGYCVNNPLKYTDPSGNVKWAEDGGSPERTPPPPSPPFTATGTVRITVTVMTMDLVTGAGAVLNSELIPGCDTSGLEPPEAPDKMILTPLPAGRSLDIKIANGLWNAAGAFAALDCMIYPFTPSATSGAKLIPVSQETITVTLTATYKGSDRTLYTELNIQTNTGNLGFSPKYAINGSTGKRMSPAGPDSYTAFCTGVQLKNGWVDLGVDLGMTYNNAYHLSWMAVTPPNVRLSMAVDPFWFCR